MKIIFIELYIIATSNFWKKGIRDKVNKSTENSNNNKNNYNLNYKEIDFISYLQDKSFNNNISTVSAFKNINTPNNVSNTTNHIFTDQLTNSYNDTLLINFFTDSNFIINKIRTTPSKINIGKNTTFHHLTL